MGPAGHDRTGASPLRGHLLGSPQGPETAAFTPGGSRALEYDTLIFVMEPQRNRILPELSRTASSSCRPISVSSLQGDFPAPSIPWVLASQYH